MKNFKSEKGSITILVLVSLVFLTTFLISSYIIMSNKMNTQKKVINDTKEIYEQPIEEIYNSYFSTENIIPIYTVEQLLAMGSGKQININGKIYTFLNTVPYILMNDLEFKENERDNILEWKKIEEKDLTLYWNDHTIVMPEMLLPVGYQQLEYIESTGTQYIDTEIPTSEILGIKATIAFTKFEGSHQGAFGGRYTSNNTSIQMIYNASSKAITLAWLDKKISIEPDLEKHDIELSNKRIVIDNEIKEEYSRENATDDVSFIIFSRRSDGSRLWNTKFFLY